MKKIPTALIIDDSERVRNSWKKKLEEMLAGKAQVNIETLDVDVFLAEMEELENRRASVRANPDGYTENTTTRIDECAILIVDFDLYEAFQQPRKPEMTAESVAYLARCFSRCGYIIGVNRGGITNRAFDLSLRDHPQFFTDLDIPVESLSSPGLWLPLLGGTGFRPWYWPSILDAAKNYNACVTSIEDTRVTPISRTGLQSEDIEVLQLEALEIILGTRGQGKGSKNALELTTKEIAQSAARSERSKDNIPKVFEARVAAARIRKWLHYIVLSAQDPISDLPHVLARIPGLAKTYSKKALNIATSLDQGKALSAFGTEAVDLRDFALPAENQIWWPASVINWRRLLNDRRIVELQMKTNRATSLVFCEDISGFLQRANARLFRSEVLSAYNARFVSDPQKAMGSIREETTGVDYEPSVRFAL